MRNKINRTVLSIVGLFLMTDPLKAAGKDHFIFQHLSEKFFLIIVGVIILSAFIALYRIMMMYFDRRAEEMLRERGLESAQVKVSDGKSIWTKFYEKATEYVPMEKEREILLDHDYDGIKELDNDLPPWWLWMFYLSIVFSIVYVAVYHFSPWKMSNVEQYEINMAHAALEVKAYNKLKGDMVDEENLEAIVDEASLAYGKASFINNCATCHLKDGGGSIGPNLTDEYWLHGGSIKDVYKTIKYGVPEKGMIAWKSQMRPIEMHQLASYIMTLGGTTPQIPKARQGELYEADIEK